MTKHSCSVKEAMNDWNYHTGYSMDESIEALIAEIEDLEEQLAETDENVEAMKEGCAQRIQDAEEEAEMLRAFANKWLGFTVAGACADWEHNFKPELITEAVALGLDVPSDFCGASDAP